MMKSFSKFKKNTQANALNPSGGSGCSESSLRAPVINHPAMSEEMAEMKKKLRWLENQL